MTKPNISTVQSYLFFDGKTEEAIEFYRKALGAEVVMMLRFKDSPQEPKAGCEPPAGTENKIMHAQFKVGKTVIMASDGRCSGHPKFDGFGLAIATATDADTDRAFNALAHGGQVQMPLEKTLFASSFGMVSDKFGVMWMIMTESAEK